MNAAEHATTRLPTDLGGLPVTEAVAIVEHPLLPWEKRCHALLDLLDYHKVVNTEEKRRGISEMGADMIGSTTYYEKWILSAARILMQKGILTPHEIGVKTAEVAARYLHGD
ncbi:MAG: nitrile hydratase subunit beta [Laribacter sp.]|nr:nitrile hydratase subunit beta [Laribacter sp.]MBP9608938.1 nitrile hydratase subunit beta [Laribacter sp.]